MLSKLLFLVFISGFAFPGVAEELNSSSREVNQIPGVFRGPGQTTGFSDDPGCDQASCAAVCVQIPSEACIVSLEGYTRFSNETPNWKWCQPKEFMPSSGACEGTLPSWLDCSESGSPSSRFALGGFSTKVLAGGWKSVCWQYKNWTTAGITSPSSARADAKFVVNWKGREPSAWNTGLEWCKQDHGDWTCGSREDESVMKVMRDQLGVADCDQSGKRSCLIDHAIKTVATNPKQAFYIALMCQCQSIEAQQLMYLHRVEVIDWLKREAQISNPPLTP